MIEVEKIATDRYRVRSHGQLITLSAQDMRELNDWCLLHMRELEQEAAQEPAPDWKAIEAQAQADLEAIQTDQDAYAFIDKYMSKELRPQLRQIYRSDRHE